MSQLKSYRLADTTFSSKKKIKEYIRSYINLLPIGSTVKDCALLELLAKHPQWKQKSAGMIRVIVGLIHVEHASVSVKGLLVERKDGFMDITWSKLVDRLQPDGSLVQLSDRQENLRKIKVAARSCIQSQITKVTKSPGEHVDHIYPRTFDRLLFIFLKWWDTPLALIEIKDIAGDCITHSFECWELADAWFEFHDRVARLRPISAKENLSAPIYPVNWDLLP